MTRVFNKLPDEWRRRFDNDRFWIKTIFVILAVFSVGGFVLNAKTNQAQVQAAKLDAIRKAETQSTYQTCVSSIPQLVRFRKHVMGVNDLAAILAQNTAAAIESAPPDDPLAATRRANLARLIAAQTEIAAVRSFPVPTVKVCAARRDAVERRAIREK